MSKKSRDGRRALPPLTPPREYRLRRGVPLVTAAVHADLPPSRASEIERFPERARPGELERLRMGVDSAASQRVAAAAQRK